MNVTVKDVTDVVPQRAVSPGPCRGRRELMSKSDRAVMLAAKYRSDLACPHADALPEALLVPLEGEQ